MVELEALTTTVIGSYPVQISNEDFIKSFYTKEDSFLKSIELSIKDQIEAGIEIISDGQTRNDMVKIFTDKIIGFKTDFGRVIAVEKLSYHDGGIILKDQMHALNFIKGKSTKLKSVLTGPSTILSMINPGVYKTRSRELLFDIAEVLRKEAEELQKTDIAYLQIDEPIFSVKPENLEDSIIALDKITQKIKIPVAIHVDGPIKKIFPKLLNLKKFDIFHMELKSTPENLEVVKEYKSDKSIGIGLVKVYDDRVETVEEIKQLVEKSLEFLDANKILLNPECGMRHLPREIAFNKLRNIVKAKEQIKKEMNL